MGLASSRTEKRDETTASDKCMEGSLAVREHSVTSKGDPRLAEYEESVADFGRETKKTRQNSSLAADP